MCEKEYRSRLEPLMEELMLILPNKTSSVSDDELIREAIDEILSLKEEINKLTIEMLEFRRRRK